MQERTIAQNKTFELKKQGYKATRILTKVLQGYGKDKKPVYDHVLTSFGYSKDRTIPKEIFENDVKKYNFVFVYEN